MLGGLIVGVIENLVGTYVKFIGTELKLTVALASGPDAYATALARLGSPLARIVLLGSLACFCYHLLNGIRHLCFDFGLGFELPAARKSALAVSVGSVLLTLLVCVVLWSRLGGTS